MVIRCLGALRTTTTTAQDGFTGMMNEFRTYSDEVLLADVAGLVSYA